MTKYDIERIGRWINKHENYVFGLLMFGAIAILGQLMMLDGLYDGGDVYDPWLHEPNPDHKIEGHKYPDMFKTIFGIILTVPFVVWLSTLPLNTLLLKLRRVSFEGEPKLNRKERKHIEREKMLRAAEHEHNLEPYELGKLSK